MSINVQAQGLVLETFDYGEGDLAAVLFTLENGKMLFKVKGAKKPGAKVAPHLQALSYVGITAVAPVWGNLPIVVGAEPLNGFSVRAENLAWALAALGLVNAFVGEGVAAPRTYEALLGYLKSLNSVTPPTGKFEQLALVVLDESGHAPCLKHCVLCGQAAGPAAAFSLVHGGILCANCRRVDREATPLSAEVVAQLLNLSDNKGNLVEAREHRTLEMVRLVLGQFANYVAPRPLYVFDFLNNF